MSEKSSKLYVFDRYEVILIFGFMILIAVISFGMGIKIGRMNTLKGAGITQSDQRKVDLLSGQEEQVNQVVHENEKTGDGVKPLDMESVHQALGERLREEMEKDPKLRKQDIDQAPKTNQLKKTEAPITPEVDEPAAVMEETPTAAKPQSEKDRFSGKYTIQLGSHRGLKEAEEFAEGFKIRGYNPIINEVILPKRGTWYRVSLGVFDSVTEAKEYIIKQRTLFQGQDYVIGRFD